MPTMLMLADEGDEDSNDRKAHQDDNDGKDDKVHNDLTGAFV